MLRASVWSLLFALLGCNGRTLDAGTVAAPLDAGAKAESSAKAESTTSTPTPPTVPISYDASAGCTDEASCSADPRYPFVGFCEEGRCRCQEGLYIVPGGKCSPKKGLGAACSDASECADDMDCYEVKIRPMEGVCSTVGKQCTIRCDDALRRGVCPDVFGPGVVCLSGCPGAEGLCTQTI